MERKEKLDMKLVQIVIMHLGREMTEITRQAKKLIKWKRETEVCMHMHIIMLCKSETVSGKVLTPWNYIKRKLSVLKSRKDLAVDQMLMANYKRIIALIPVAFNVENFKREGCCQ